MWYPTKKQERVGDESPKKKNDSKKRNPKSYLSWFPLQFFHIYDDLIIWRSDIPLKLIFKVMLTLG